MPSLTCSLSASSPLDNQPTMAAARCGCPTA